MDTRPSDNDQAIRRRRECGTCNRRFTTYERIELELPMVVKKDGRREAFDRAKLMSGLKKACEKRPVPVEVIDKQADKIERSLQDLGEKEVPSTKVGDAVMGALREVDDVAYLRFASVYLSVRDVAELMREVQRLAGSGTSTAAPAPAATPPAPARGHDPNQP